MTGNCARNDGIYRHCEARSNEAIQSFSNPDEFTKSIKITYICIMILTLKYEKIIYYHNQLQTAYIRVLRR
jgi:hypothetical protein